MASGVVYGKFKEERPSRKDCPSVHRVQAEELYYREESPQYTGETRAHEVLPIRAQAHSPQRDKD